MGAIIYHDIINIFRLSKLLPCRSAVKYQTMLHQTTAVAIMVALLLSMVKLGEVMAAPPDGSPIDGCPSILQESVYSSGFYSKLLSSSAYFAFQDSVCNLQMDDSKDIVLPLVGPSLDSFIQAAKVLVTNWSPSLEAAIIADTSLSGSKTQVRGNRFFPIIYIYI